MSDGRIKIVVSIEADRDVLEEALNTLFRQLAAPALPKPESKPVPFSRPEAFPTLRPFPRRRP